MIGRRKFNSTTDELRFDEIIIYPGKLTQAETFRIGTIGRIFKSDIERLLAAVQECVQELGIKVPVA